MTSWARKAFGAFEKRPPGLDSFACLRDKLAQSTERKGTAGISWTK